MAEVKKAVRKTPLEQKQTEEVRYGYMVTDLTLSGHYGSPRILLVDIYTGNKKLTEAQIPFEEPSVQGVHEAVVKWIRLNRERLDLLRQVSKVRVAVDAS